MVERNGTVVPESGGIGVFGAENGEGIPLVGFAPPLAPEHLGDPGFCSELGLRFPYLGGSMAKGISSAPWLEELGREGMLGFFGAAGLPLSEVEAAVDRLAGSLGDLPYGFNLIHSPHEPDLESELAGLYIRKGVRLVEASAFLDLTLPLVRYRVHGIHRRADGTIVTPNRIIAKVSREELAAKFLSPPPDALLRELVNGGAITAEQAELAARIPLAQEVTAEADSGGHTDNRPAIALFPTIRSLASRLEAKYGYDRKLRVGLAGGISTPAAAAAAFAMGAAYIMTGSVNQACVRIGHLGRSATDACRDAPGRCDHGPGRRHVRNGRERAGPEAGHHVSDARRQALRAVPCPWQPRRNPARRTGEAGEDPVPGFA